MQNEVHRFAITFFRKTISKSMTASVLDNVKGIGLNRKKKLLETFDNIDDIKNASVEKLKSLGLPMDVITNLLNALK